MIVNPYSKPYYTSLRGGQVGKDVVTNGFNYTNRTRQATFKVNSILHSFSSDSDESDSDSDFFDFNPNYQSSPQSSINCTPIPVQLSAASLESTPLKNMKVNKALNDHRLKKRKNLNGKPFKTGEVETMSKLEDTQNYTHTPQKEKIVKREGGYDTKKEVTASQKSEFEMSTPEVSKRQARGGLKHSYSDVNLDSNLTSYVDSMFGVEPYKYVHEHQPLTLFWLHNSELSGLMMVPTLASLSNELSNAEKMYMVFTDDSIDIVQDVSNLKMITPREGYTPFVVTYSYNLKSMYFKVVKRKVTDVDMVSFNKTCNDLDDCLSYETQPSSRSSASLQLDPSYEFYRSYLFGKDDTTDPNRLRVFVHPSNKTSFDMRYLSVNSYTSNRGFSIKSDRSEFNDKSKESFDEVGENPLEESDGTASSESPFSYACQNNEELDLPDELFEECKLLVGVTETGKNSGHPDSVANYRSESVIKKNFVVYLVDEGNRELGKEVMANLIKVRDEGNVIYRSGELTLCEKQSLKIQFPTIYTKHFEHDYVTLYSDSTLKSCFNFIKSLQPEECLNININKLAQFCPNIFWNLALTGDIETSIIELDPDILKSLYRRRRTTNTEVDPYVTTRPKKQNSLGYLDNNFIIMQNLFKRDAEEKIKKLREIERQNGCGGKMSRVLINKHMDEESLVKILMDEHGFTRKSMRVLTDKQKNLVYTECMKRNFYVPVHIKFNPLKGRGVYAAHRIHKEDFLMEYKGELITEKVAKYRNNKYNSSKKYKGSFIFFFKYNGKRYGIDATEEDISFGPARLVNHSKRSANIVPKTMTSDNYPRLIFVAKRDIECGEELLVDYGERDPSVIKDNPWLLD